MERYLLADSQVSRGYEKKEKELVKFWAQNHGSTRTANKIFLSPQKHEKILTVSK